MHNLDLSIADIAKIEGKATCDIKVRDGKVESVKFAIAEFKRFYTKAIRGKDILAIPQMTARICGTCSNAHLLCAVQAVENALQVTPSDQTIALRKLLNYGLIIRDHTLHLYVFVLPDLFGKDSLLDFDEHDPEQHKYLDDTFAIKAAGNNLSKIVGGRSVHAPFVTVGGFTRLPTQEQLAATVKELLEIRPLVLDMIKLFATRDFSLYRDDIVYAAICDHEYSFLHGDLVRSDGSTIPGSAYANYLSHVPIPYSQASGYMYDGTIYMTGALARLNLAKNRLHSETQRSAEEYLSYFPTDNIYRNNLAQAIEVLHAIDSSISIISGLSIQPEPPPTKETLLASIAGKTEATTGIAVIEAPRGALYYKLDVLPDGKVKDGQIVVPTGQNQICIEGCIRYFLEENIQNFDTNEQIEHEVEKIVRAFDPCMSCASHFLKVKWV